jgi:hypothetical protein
MGRSLRNAIAALALAAVMPTAAQAVTFGSQYNFDFSESYRIGTTGNSSLGNSMTFRSTSDASLQVKVTAWSIDRLGTTGTGDDIVNAAILRLWSGGLGVQNKNEANTSPNHSIDNSGLVDFVLLQFNYDVDIDRMTTGWVNTDSDASLRVGTGPTNNPGTWANTPNLEGKKVYGSTGAIELSDYINMSDTSLDSSGGSSAGSRSVNSSNQHGMVWLIGALYGTQSNDYFKLDALKVTVFPTIPEPSTWLTMILGFGFIGGVMRRRNAPVGKGVASLT